MINDYEHPTVQIKSDLTAGRRFLWCLQWRHTTREINPVPPGSVPAINGSFRGGWKQQPSLISVDLVGIHIFIETFLLSSNTCSQLETYDSKYKSS
jgi:hypothetical protein